MSGVKIEIVGVGAYVKGEGDKRARPYRRDAVLTVDEAVADRLIAAGVAVREGERPTPADDEPVIEPEADSSAEDGPGSEPDLDGLTVPELEDLAQQRGVEVEGTGADGRVLKADLLKALA